jgi:hypothetical protein
MTPHTDCMPQSCFIRYSDQCRVEKLEHTYWWWWQHVERLQQCNYRDMHVTKIACLCRQPAAPCGVLDETTVENYIETCSGTEQWVPTEQVVTPRHICTRTHNNRYRRYTRQSLGAVTFSSREILNYFVLCRHIQTVKKYCCAVFRCSECCRKIKK